MFSLRAICVDTSNGEKGGVFEIFVCVFKKPNEMNIYLRACANR